jgi:hypothetical protein
MRRMITFSRCHNFLTPPFMNSWFILEFASFPVDDLWKGRLHRRSTTELNFFVKPGTHISRIVKQKKADRGDGHRDGNKEDKRHTPKKKPDIVKSWWTSSFLGLRKKVYMGIEIMETFLWGGKKQSYRHSLANRGIECTKWVQKEWIVSRRGHFDSLSGFVDDFSAWWLRGLRWHCSILGNFRVCYSIGSSSRNEEALVSIWHRRKSIWFEDRLGQRAKFTFSG